jgi:glutathione reductase (NADPH)
MEYDFDLFVIGAGSGGVRSARMAAAMGARVAIAEADRFGGTCVIRGCVPKKLMVYASRFAEEFQAAVGFGWRQPDTAFDWPTLIANKDKEIARLEGLYRKGVENAGVTIFADRAVLKDQTTLHLTRENRDVTAETILIATGGQPSRNTGLAEEQTQCCITSDEAFHLERLPKSIIIAGGGYIALEFAHIFHGLGSEVTLVYRGDKVLKGFDDDMRDALQDSMRKKGIKVVCGTIFESCSREGDLLRARTKGGHDLRAEQIMLAIGRSPNTKGLGLENAGVHVTAKGHIQVDDYSCTSADNIYAVGDVTGRMELTPVAIHEAMCFVETVFGGNPTKPNHAMVATAVFTTPEIGTVGLSEAAALEKGHRIDIYKAAFKPLKHTLSGRDEKALLKLVVDADTDKVLGCHVFAHDAGEIVQLVAIAMKMGATKAQFDATVAVHPTLAEELVTMRTKAFTREPGKSAA